MCVPLKVMQRELAKDLQQQIDDQGEYEENPSSSSSAAVKALASSSSSPLPTTVAGTLRLAHFIFHNELPNMMPMENPEKYQSKVNQCLQLFLRLWSHIENEGVFRKSEALSEMSDTSLELITVAFHLGVLCDKKQNLPSASSSSSSSTNSATSAASGSSSSSSSSSSVDSRTGQVKQDEVSQRIARSNSRMQSLLACNDFLFKFLKVAVEVGLAKEKDIATKPFASSLDRTTRLEISKKRFALEDEFKQLDSKVRYCRERAKRNARLMRQDDFDGEVVRKMKKGGGDNLPDELLEHEEGNGSSNNADNDNEERTRRTQDQEAAVILGDEVIENLLEDDDDYQSVKRQRHLRFAEWCIYESYSLLQGNASELQILGSLNDDEKRKAIEDFQRNLQSGGGKNNGGFSTSAASSSFNELSRGQTTTSSITAAEGEKLQNQNYTVLPNGSVVPFGSVANPEANFRQQVREEAFQNRNMPTQTLEEYADIQMAYMSKMAKKEAQGKLESQAVDESLGDEGVEERERKKTSAWDDWKDDNPPIGISTKGNYS